jgi:hypothetical protein
MPIHSGATRAIQFVNFGWKTPVRFHASGVLLLGKILRPSGVLVFHDYQNRSVFTALCHIEANFQYTTQPSSAKNLCILVKKQADARPWYYFVPFRVPAVAWTTLEDRPLVDPAREGAFPETF